MAKTTTRVPHSPVQARRKSSLGDVHKKDKGRSRNACDRCKQKKVKCDGEGQRVCSICREGDYQCTYAQRPHDEKRQYRKGYVEMVEEANSYYKNGLHEFYRRFEKADIFKSLHLKYGSGGMPTVQEIICALGVPSTGKPHEGGISAIEDHLEKENKPMLIRHGEWDREISQTQQSPSTLAHDHDMDDDSDASSPSASPSDHYAPEDEHYNRPEGSPTPYSVVSQHSYEDQRRASAYFVAPQDGVAGSASSINSPLKPGTPDMFSFPNMYSTMPAVDYDYSGSVASYGDLNFPLFPETTFVAPAPMATVSPSQLEVFPHPQFESITPHGALAASMLKSGHFAGAMGNYRREALHDA